MQRIIVILPVILLCATLRSQQLETGASSGSGLGNLGKSPKEHESLAAKSPRLRERLDDNWKFIFDDPKDSASVSFDDTSWRTVTLPHDWSIEGRIDPKAQMGGDGGFLPSGIGWYRKCLEAPKIWGGKRVQVEFEGVYMNAEVYLNGKKLATQPWYCVLGFLRAIGSNSLRW